jgi:hypothetical protein
VLLPPTSITGWLCKGEKKKGKATETAAVEAAFLLHHHRHYH